MGNLEVPDVLPSFLDNETSVGVARQLLQARQRLARRLNSAPPRVVDLAAAMRAHMSAEDKRRAEKVAGRGLAGVLETGPARETAPLDSDIIANMYCCLQLSDLAYTADREKLAAAVAPLDYEVLEMREKAEPFAPSYFVAHCTASSTLALVIRGTREPADILTDLSTQTNPFLGCRAHSGIARSATRLHEEVGPLLGEHALRLRPTRVLLTGHSLGGGAAAALTLLLRAGESAEMSKEATAALTAAECVAFCPPAFLTDRETAMSAAGIVSLVHGMDVVPRLSVSGLDRLMFHLATAEAKEEERSAMQRTVEGVFLEGMERVALTVSSALVRQAKSGTPLTISEEFSELSKVMNEELVELEDGEEPEQTFLAGKIFCLERLFSEDRRCGTHDGLCASSFQEKSAMELLEIEVSEHMLEDHYATGLLEKFKAIVESLAQPCTAVWTA